MAGTVLSATISAFGLGGGVLAKDLVKRLVWEFLPPTTIDRHGLLPHDPATSVCAPQIRNSVAGTSNKGCGTNSTQTVFHPSSWPLQLA